MEKERYEEVVYQYSDMVTRIAVMNVKNYDDAKDCYQNVFMKLYCYNKKFESEEHLKAWLIRVTINVKIIKNNFGKGKLILIS